jgi:hypothetical protein
VEAAFTVTISSRELPAGRLHVKIEAALEEAVLGSHVAGRPGADRGLWARVTICCRSWTRGSRCFGDTYQALDRGAHLAHAGDLDLLIRGARMLVDKVRASLL